MTTTEPICSYDLHPRMNPPTAAEMAANADGTYTLFDQPGGDWTVRDTGQGWEAFHPHDGFDDARFLTKEDAVRAVLDNPYHARLFGGGIYGEVYR